MDNVTPNMEARKEFLRVVRNIGNACLCIGEWADQSEANAMESSALVNWGWVGSAKKVLSDLQEIGRFLDIEIKEV